MHLHQDARVEDAGHDHTHAKLVAKGQELIESGLIEQGVPARQQHGVELTCANEPSQHRRLVHAGADGADCSLAS